MITYFVVASLSFSFGFVVHGCLLPHVEPHWIDDIDDVVYVKKF